MRNIGVKKSRLRVGFKGIVNTLDEALLDMEYTNKAYNFAFENGVLTGGIGIDTAAGYYPSPSVARHDYPAVPDNKSIKDVFLYRRLDSDGNHDDRIVIQLTNGTFWYTAVFKNDTWHNIENLIMTGEVSAANYNYNGMDVLLLSSDDDHLYIINDALPLVCTGAPRFTSITVHNERVYGSVSGSQNQVWFSDDFNPANWSVSPTEAGFINFTDECGEVIKVVSFLNYLYVFREYGVFRLTAYGDQNEFLLKKVFTDTGRIVKSSIEVCGNKIIFYADNGLYSFDGYEVTRIARELMPMSRTHLISGAYLDDCYFMACDIWDTDTKNNAVVRYCFADKSLSVLYGYAVRRLRTVRMHNGSQVLCVFAAGSTGKLGMMSKSGKVMGTATQKKYVSPYSSLSTDAVKTLRSISLITSQPLTLTVKLDDKNYVYQLSGSEKLQTVHVEHCGRMIGFELDCASGNAYVSPLNVTLDVMQ